MPRSTLAFLVLSRPPSSLSSKGSALDQLIIGVIAFTAKRKAIRGKVRISEAFGDCQAA